MTNVTEESISTIKRATDLIESLGQEVADLRRQLLQLQKQSRAWAMMVCSANTSIVDEDWFAMTSSAVMVVAAAEYLTQCGLLEKHSTKNLYRWVDA